MQNKKIRAALAGLLVATSAMAFSQGRVSGISVTKQAKGVEVLIQGSGLKEPKSGFGTTDTVYSLEFDVPYAGKQEKIQVWSNGLETVKATMTGKKPVKTTLEFKFTKGVNATLSKAAKGYKIAFEASDKLASLTKNKKVKAVEPKVAANKTATQTFFSPHFLSAPEPITVASKIAPIKGATADTNQWKKTLPAVNANIVDPKVTESAVQAHNFAGASTKAKTNKPAKTTEAPVKVTNDKKDGDPRVSLDFVNTDVVQILKSLARQTSANIVTSPDVTGKLSIKLDNVTIRESLNLVTSLAGLRFAQVGKTYVVTSQAKFLETLRSVQGNQEEMTLSRIVPIFSGQGNQIKVAVLKSVSSENAFGRFELVLPSEKTMVSVTQKVGTDKKDDAKAGTSIESQTSESTTDQYVMVIGSPGRLDEVEQIVASIDRQLCSALGIKISANNKQILSTYYVHGGRATDLVDALAGKGKTSVGNVQLFATPTNSIAKQSIVVKGRQDEVESVMEALTQLDSDETAVSNSEFKIIDLLYADPRATRELVVANVPGVTCVIAPNGVMNPLTYTQDGIRTQSEQRGTDQPAPQGGGTPLASGQGQQNLQNNQQGGGQGTDAKQVKDNADSGMQLPFEQFEKVAVPMRLIIKGSHDQVERAIEWIRATDIAPKQVALEMRVMELSREELVQLGIDWNLFTSGAIKTISLNNSFTNPANKIGVGVQGKDVSGDVGLTLDSISNGSNLISRPNLLCNDGRQSEVFVGDAIRYIESILSSQNGPSVTTGTVRAGVRLACLPRIGGSDTLNLDIRTAITYLKGFKTVPQIGGELPQTSERTAQNTITLKDGETFAIGGLIQQQDVVELSGLPILKDLPIVGQFFRRTKKDKIKTELIIFVTAKVVGPGKPKTMPMSKDSALLKNKTALPGDK